METPNTVAIVGSGPSVRNQTVEADLIIAVNSAIGIVKPDIWFTLDLSPENQRIVYARKPGVRYMAALPEWRDLPPWVVRLRRIEGNFARPHNLTTANMAHYWMWRWSAMPGLSEDLDAIHTGNSAYGALGLAYHMRPKNIVLYGIDATQEARCTGGFPNRLDHLPMLFASAIPQLKKAGIKVYNASPISKVTCFLRLP